MLILRKGRYSARFADSDDEILCAQSLRYRCFQPTSAAPAPSHIDADRFDASCEHILIADTATGSLVCCFRLMRFTSGRKITQSYAAQFYDLTKAQDFNDPLLEIGRFCMSPDHHDPDILRLAWAALTRFVDQHRIKVLFGCSSFSGVDGWLYRDTFALLGQRYLAKPDWMPKIKAPDIFAFDKNAKLPLADLRRGMKRMPPLLRSYLALGGWVSDHAVVDKALNTLHVFTGLNIDAIPAGRARLLRATAQL